MSIIRVDIESNKPDLDALVETANAKIGELQAILTEISAFQVTFTVTEVPTSEPAPTAEPELPVATE